MISKLKTFFQIILAVRNWFTVALIWFFPKKEVVALFRNGYQTDVSEKNRSDFVKYVDFFRAFPDGSIKDAEAKLSYNKINLVFDFSKKSPAYLGNIIEVFGQGIYEPFLKDFDFTGRLVVDIGAALGDTAIYFALKGAKNVYAFEPAPNFYYLARRNIILNNLDDKCKIFNMAVGKDKRSNNLEDQTFKNMFINDSEAREYENDKKIPMTTLQKITENFNLSNAFLKLDCEGYEYDIILNAPKEVLSRFEYIIMEYHYGFESLRDKLEESGFLVEHTKPSVAIMNDRPGKYRKMTFGYLTARRIGWFLCGFNKRTEYNNKCIK